MDVLFALGAIPLVIVGIIVLAVIALIYAKVVYRNAGADEALIITGKRSRKVKNDDGTETVESGIKVVLGAGVLVRPFFEKVAKLSLSSRAIDINVNAQDSRGVTIDVEAVALVKVGETDASIRAAAQRFLGQEKKIDDFAREVLSGSLRASIGATDVSTIIRKRDQLTVAVLDVAKDALHSQGLRRLVRDQGHLGPQRVHQ
ncbi:SPFH domain-containing protein [Curtobacterium poinsettiae]|uniref:SPFH domain-containing protein n=1 Tax=Curtobacterium poinsettiae TaxID=159612 RepID=UPI0021C99661|nr:SPFH domain-containing protein [Curtobacterium flaccumfaciens]MCU0152873.1 SPFH domain-containing protein [Curtobacterium flaccumfaciens pv. poinsettiae]UXN15167.1 SPFH domain-containing protein [Curtobacterium flaccumfaciens pv. poinsettiae]